MASLPTGPFDNAEAIYKGLLAMGLSTDAAAGVAGNIYQESHGNPGSSSGAGGGLFGEETQNGGTVNGGTLAEQLKALFAYIQKNGSISSINSHASSPSEAASYFMSNYERPNASQANESVRIAAAEWVAESAKSGNWGSSKGTPNGSSPSSNGNGLLSFPSDITGFFGDADTFVTKLAWLSMPATWLRIVAFLAGTALLLFAIYALVSVGEGSDRITPKMPAIVPVPI